MDITVAKSAGFCMGVSRAVALAESELKDGPAYVLGELIHNPGVVERLRKKGLVTVGSIEDVPDLATVIIRSHGEGRAVFERASEKKLKVVDATCVYVKNIQKKVEDYHSRGFQVVIIGEASHPEVKGIDGWCGGSAVIFGGEGVLDLNAHEKVCIVVQTTANPQYFRKILKNIVTDKCKTVEVFNTICYTTIERNLEVAELSKRSDAVVVVGGKGSSNTRRLYELALQGCEVAVWIEDISELDIRSLSNYKKVAIVAGASTPGELIKEVKTVMSEINTNQVLGSEDTEAVNEAAPVADAAVSQEDQVREEVSPSAAAPTADEQPQEDAAPEAEAQVETEANAQAETSEAEAEAKPEAEADANAEAPEVEPSPAIGVRAAEQEGREITMADIVNDLSRTPTIRRGSVLKATIVLAGDEGIVLQNGAKGEIQLSKDEVVLEGEEYDKSAFQPGDELEVLVTGTQPLQVSRKAFLLGAIEDSKVAKLVDGETFKVKVEGFNKGGLTGRLGSYSVFIPSSQIRMGFVRGEELEKYVGKELRLKALKVERKNITASARPIIEEERAAREIERQKFLKEFFATIEVGHIVEGKVVRFAAFGAFVNVNGFDCLAHISDLAWTNVKRAEDILKKDQIYEFVVLKVDAENQRVSIGYKQLQPKPWDVAAEKYAIGSVIKGKIVRIAGFGAFVEVEPGIDGLVHVSQISHEWIENPTSALKVGQEVDVKVLDIRPEEEKLTLSIKALTDEPEGGGEQRRPRRRDDDGVEGGAPASSDRIQRFERKAEASRERSRDRRPREDDGPREWNSSDNTGASIGELLKGLDLKLGGEEEKPATEEKAAPAVKKAEKAKKADEAVTADSAEAVEEVKEAGSEE